MDLNNRKMTNHPPSPAYIISNTYNPFTGHLGEKLKILHPPLELQDSFETT